MSFVELQLGRVLCGVNAGHLQPFREEGHVRVAGWKLCKTAVEGIDDGLRDLSWQGKGGRGG